MSVVAGEHVRRPRRARPAARSEGAVRRLSRVMVLAVVVLAPLVAGCSGKAPAPRPAVPQVHRLAGNYTVHGIFRHRNFGAPCVAADAGYADIHAGTPVVVRDE